MRRRGRKGDDAVASCCMKNYEVDLRGAAAVKAAIKSVALAVQLPIQKASINCMLLKEELGAASRIKYGDRSHGCALILHIHMYS